MYVGIYIHHIFEHKEQQHYTGVVQQLVTLIFLGVRYAVYTINFELLVEWYYNCERLVESRYCSPFSEYKNHCSSCPIQPSSIKHSYSEWLSQYA